MSFRSCRILSLACLLCSAQLGFTVRAVELEDRVHASREAFAAPVDSSSYRKYMPDREMDILHVALDVTPDFAKRTVSGKMTMKFKPIARPLAELKLNGLDLNVSGVTGAARILAYQSTRDQVIITFADPVPVDQEASITITYSAEPHKGLYFRTEAMGYPAGDDHLFSQGEAIEARHWYPCYDAPNEKFTSEVTCHVPEGMTVLSNGRKVSESKDAAGLKVVTWSQEKPHVNYLITLCAGYFKKVEDKFRDLPIAFYVPASDIDEAAGSFKDTKDALGFFEEEIGVPYPWAKYDQVCTHDFVEGGMENTSQTTLTDNTLFSPESENIHDSRGLMAHELAHQWFGDLVTCKDWSHVWLNEGFATYYDALHARHLLGQDEFLYEMCKNARGFLDNQNDTIPIVYRKYDSPDEQFSFRAYPKGAWVLHMLRGQLGEALYRKCIKAYIERHAYGNVVTDDLKNVIEEFSGRSFDQFFDQWVYHAHHPELEVNYSWDARTKLAKLTVKQVQKVSEDVAVFNFPLAIRFKSHGTVTDREIVVKEKAGDFYFNLAEAPEIVRLDPNYQLLAKISFQVPNGLLYAQLADQTDVIGRIFAVEQLAARRDHEAVDRLKQALNNDPFYGVRVEAAKALRSIHSDDTFAALQASATQRDARVRREVATGINSFYKDEAYAAARKMIEAGKNPELVADAIQALAGYSKPEVRDLLLKNLDSRSYKNRLANAAITGVRSQDDPACLTPLREALARREKELTASSFNNGLDTLAYLARNETSKDATREFLLRYVDHPRESTARAAIAALGTLGDPKALPVIEKFAASDKDNPLHTAAVNARTALRAARKPVDDFKNLRDEVLELQKKDRELRHELDDLKKQVEAAKAQTTDSRKKSKR